MRRPFPWILCLFNGLVIFVSFLLGAVVPGLLWTLRDGLVGFLMLFFMEAYIGAVICGALMALSLPYHAGVFFVFRRIGNTVIWRALFLLPAILLIGTMVHGSVPTVKARTILSRGELAPLPKSARCVRVGCVSYVIGGTRFLKFRASREDIQHFLGASASLHGHESESSSKQKIGLAQLETEHITSTEQSGNHKNFSPDSAAPAWYKQELTGRERYYRIPDQGVEVIVDDEENVVFVKVSRSYM